MALGGRRRRGGGGLDAWPGYVDALSTLLMVIIFVLLVFVLGQGFLSVALSSRDRALDRLNRQVSELSELLSLERGQAEELRGSLGRLTDDLRAAISARDTALEGLSGLREERERLVAERDAARGERSRLSARLADLELSARDGSARITDLEGRLAEAQARAEAAGGDTARTVRTLTDAQRLLAAERAALEAVRRDLALSRTEAQALGGELATQRTALADLDRQLQETLAARDAAAQALSASRQQVQALTGNLEATRRDLAEQRDARSATARELAELRALSAAQLEERRREAEALAADLATTRSALEVARRDLAEQTQARSATAQELAEVRALTTAQLEERRREAEALATALANARTALEAARRATEEQTAARSATARELAELRALTATQLEERQRQAEALAAELATARAALATARQEAAAQASARAATAQELAEARATASRDLEARRQEAAALAAQLAEARQGLEAARRDLAAMRAEAERLDQTVTADRATIQARLSDIASLSEQVRGLQALRDQLEREAQQALDRAGTEARLRQTAEAAQAEAQTLLQQMTGRATQAEQGREAAAQLAAEAGRRAAEEARRRAAAETQAGEFGRLSESARAQAALLTRQLEALRSELSRITAALDAAEDAGRDKDAQISTLGQRLNVALAARVEELQQYRSDFFGRLRQVLGSRADVQIVGDRFVFQSEVLFPVGSAEMSAAGQQQIRQLGGELLRLAQRFPPDLGWLLRVDGHADRTPIRGGGRFASNWELSAARAIAVAQLLIDSGLPPNRVAAVAFGDTQPLDDQDTPEAMARNRRIELRLEPAPSGAAPRRAEAPAPSGGDLSRALAQAVPDQACARLGVAGGRVLGVAQNAVLARLGAALRAAGIPASANAARGFGGPYCPVLDALRPVRETAGLDLVGAGPLARGSLLRLDLTMPGWAGQVSLYYLSTSGEVYRLDTREGLAAGSRTRFGDPASGFPGWQVDEPFGTDLVLAVASAGPLFAEPRPDAEPIASFAPALASALATARRNGRAVAVGLLPVETVAR